jgi:hypothetical protein
VLPRGTVPMAGFAWWVRIGDRCVSEVVLTMAEGRARVNCADVGESRRGRPLAGTESSDANAPM